MYQRCSRCGIIIKKKIKQYKKEKTIFFQWVKLLGSHTLFVSCLFFLHFYLFISRNSTKKKLPLEKLYIYVIYRFV